MKHLRSKVPQIVFFIFFICLFFYSKYKWKNLKYIGKLTNGKFIETKSVKWGFLRFYVFKFSGNYIKNSDSGSIGDPELEQYIRNYKFPVIYNEKELESSQILIFKEDFEIFGYAYPDSLNHVEIKREEIRKKTKWF